MLIKRLAPAKPPTSVKGRANHNHMAVPSNTPPDNPSRRVDVIDIEEVVSKVNRPPRIHILQLQTLHSPE